MHFSLFTLAKKHPSSFFSWNLTTWIAVHDRSFIKRRHQGYSISIVTNDPGVDHGRGHVYVCRNRKEISESPKPTTSSWTFGSGLLFMNCRDGQEMTCGQHLPGRHFELRLPRHEESVGCRWLMMLTPEFPSIWSVSLIGSPGCQCCTSCLPPDRAVKIFVSVVMRTFGFVSFFLHNGTIFESNDETVEIIKFQEVPPNRSNDTRVQTVGIKKWSGAEEKKRNSNRRKGIFI